jgi:hypothetical protein
MIDPIDWGIEIVKIHPRSSPFVFHRFKMGFVGTASSTVVASKIMRFRFGCRSIKIIACSFASSKELAGRTLMSFIFKRGLFGGGGTASLSRRRASLGRIAAPN